MNYRPDSAPKPQPLRAMHSSAANQAAVLVRPWVALTLVVSQILGACITADMLYVIAMIIVNGALALSLRWHTHFLRMYVPVFVAVGWAIAMRWGFFCSGDIQWSEIFMCTKRPGRGVVAVCMAYSSLVMLHSAVVKDEISRALLRLGLDRQLLWLLFAIRTLGISLLGSKARSSQLLAGKYRHRAAPIRWMHLTTSSLASSFVRTLARHWYSREAEATRLREHRGRPIFIQSDCLTHGDAILLAIAFTVCKLAAVLTW